MNGKKFSILQVINTAQIGGGMRHIYALLKHIPRDRFDLRLVADHGDFLIDEIRALGVPVHFVPLMKRRFNPGAVRQIAKIARQANADILHLHGTRAGFYGALARPLARVKHSVYTVHGFSFHKDLSAAQRFFYLAVERFCTRAHSQVISVSGTDRDEAIRLGLCPPRSIKTIYNGIDFNAFDPAKVNGYLRHTFRLSPQTPLIGTVARLVPQKGVEFYLEMCRLVAAQQHDARFVVIGEGEQADTLRKRADKLGLDGRVLFTGAQQRMPECYAGLDVVVLSSLWEGHPIGLIESLAMARPTVATLTSGSPEIIDNGETGFLVAPKDPQALAEKVLWFLEHRERGRQMAGEGRQRCLRRFSEKATAEQTLAVYQQLLAGS